MNRQLHTSLLTQAPATYSSSTSNKQQAALGHYQINLDNLCG